MSVMQIRKLKSTMTISKRKVLLLMKRHKKLSYGEACKIVKIDSLMSFAVSNQDCIELMKYKSKSEFYQFICENTYKLNCKGFVVKSGRTMIAKIRKYKKHGIEEIIEKRFFDNVEARDFVSHDDYLESLLIILKECDTINKAWNFVNGNKNIETVYRLYDGAFISVITDFERRERWFNYETKSIHKCSLFLLSEDITFSFVEKLYKAVGRTFS